MTIDLLKQQRREHSKPLTPRRSALAGASPGRHAGTRQEAGKLPVAIPRRALLAGGQTVPAHRPDPAAAGPAAHRPRGRVAEPGQGREGDLDLDRQGHIRGTPGAQEVDKRPETLATTERSYFRSAAGPRHRRMSATCVNGTSNPRVAGSSPAGRTSAPMTASGKRPKPARCARAEAHPWTG
jgi:hypothetical protein